MGPLGFAAVPRAAPGCASQPVDHREAASPRFPKWVCLLCPSHRSLLVAIFLACFFFWVRREGGWGRGRRGSLSSCSSASFLHPSHSFSPPILTLPYPTRHICYGAPQVFASCLVGDLNTSKIISPTDKVSTATATSRTSSPAQETPRPRKKL